MQYPNPAAFFLLPFLFLAASLAADSAPEPASANSKWYAAMPTKALLSADGLSMKIGSKTYRVYNMFDPIAPKGGEQVLDSAGVLNYYMWVHKKDNGFTISRIAMNLSIYYYDQETEEWTSPAGKVFTE